MYQLIANETDPLLVCLSVIGDGMDDDVNGEHHVEEPANRVRRHRNREHNHECPAERMCSEGRYVVISVLRVIPVIGLPRPAFHLREDPLQVEVVKINWPRILPSFRRGRNRP